MTDEADRESTGADRPRVMSPRVLADARGVFFETYRKEAFDRDVGPTDFVQDNQSLSRLAGTIRGLHYQAPPFAQGKLVRVVRGAIFDVAVDIRRGSPGYGRYESAILSAENKAQFWVPVGFAHGFCTLEPDTEVVYKVTAVYSAGHDLGILCSDPNLEITWPDVASLTTLSEKDKALPRLKDASTPFVWRSADGAGVPS